MFTSLHVFIKGIAQRWWLWAVAVPSGIFTVLDMYLPQSAGLLASVRGGLPEAALLISVVALIAASFQTFHEQRLATVKNYDPAVGEKLHQLYNRGSDIARGAGRMVGQRPDPQAWVDEVVELLREHMPGELRMFQTAGDDHGFGFIPMRLQRIQHGHQLRPKVEKLRLIMGRYEARQ